MYIYIMEFNDHCARCSENLQVIFYFIISIKLNGVQNCREIILFTFKDNFKIVFLVKHTF